MGQLRDHICGSRGNEDNVRRLRKGNMFNGKLKVPVKRIHQAFISGQCLFSALARYAILEAAILPLTHKSTVFPANIWNPPL